MAPTRRRIMSFRSKAICKKLDLLRSIKSAPAVVGQFYIPPPPPRSTSHKAGTVRLPSFQEQPIVFRDSADSLADKLEWYLCRLGSLDLTLVRIKKLAFLQDNPSGDNERYKAIPKDLGETQLWYRRRLNQEKQAVFARIQLLNWNLVKLHSKISCASQRHATHDVSFRHLYTQVQDHIRHLQDRLRGHHPWYRNHIHEDRARFPL